LVAGFDFTQKIRVPGNHPPPTNLALYPAPKASVRRRAHFFHSFLDASGMCTLNRPEFRRRAWSWVWRGAPLPP